MGTGLVGKVGVSAGTLGATAEGASVANTTSDPSKKPPMGTPMKAESFTAVGWYIERGSGSS